MWVVVLAGWCAVVGGQIPSMSPNMKPLIGGHLYWTVDKRFGEGGRNRKVTFTLTTAFEADDAACTYNKGAAVSCQGPDSTNPKNGVADVHGVLCIKMIRHTDQNDSPEIVTAQINNEDGSLGPCPYVWKTTRNDLSDADDTKCRNADPAANWDSGIKCYSNVHPLLTSISGTSFRPASGTTAEVLSSVGTENDFEVLTVHDDEKINVFNYKINHRKIVFGAKQHTVIVPDDVTGIVAYLAAANGTIIGADQGMLMQPCNSKGNNLLITSPDPVMCSHNTQDVRDENGIKAPAFHSQADTYWNQFLDDAVVPTEEMLQPYADATNPDVGRLGRLPTGKSYSGEAWAVNDATRGMSEEMWALKKQSPALETYVPLCSSHAMANGERSPRHCTTYPLGNYFSPVSGLPPVIEIAMTPRTILQPHVYGPCKIGVDRKRGICNDPSETAFYSSLGPIMLKAYDMDGQKLSLYHPGMSDVSLGNKTARCWNGDLDALGLWDPQQVGTSPRYECFGGPDNGLTCKDDSTLCTGSYPCQPAWPIRMCTHTHTCSNGDGSSTNPEPKRCSSDADCVVPGKCLAPPHTLGQPLPSPILGMNCSAHSECEAKDAHGKTILGSCRASWSLCREMFDMDRSSKKDLNRQGFLLKLDYDWVRVGDLGPRVPQLFATAGWVVTEGLPKEGQPHSVFMSHVIGIADMPFLDVDNPLHYSTGTGSKVARDVVTDHIRSRPSLIDLQRGGSSENKLATSATASVMTQHIFSTFPCYSGNTNAPPEFFSTSSPSTATRMITTDIECKRIGACIVDLHIIDYVIKSDGLQDGFKVSPDRIAIEMTLGTAPITEGQLRNLNDGSGANCEGHGHLSCRFQLQNELWDRTTGSFSPSAVGNIVVKCFVAVDKHDDTDCNGGMGDACTCRSLPLCIKFKIVGSPPEFIAPTPLQENSLDDNGILVPGRTDVAACEGYEMLLPLEAKDADGDGVRIFVQDPDVNHDLYRARTDWYRSSGGRYNADFFDAQAVLTPEHCGTFQGYGAILTGSNDHQQDLSPSLNQSGVPLPGQVGNNAAFKKSYVVKSVNGDYRSDIQYVPEPKLSVKYLLDRTKGNGVDVSSAQNTSCVRHHNGDGTSTLRCREKLANMDQVICAYAYDNSRRKAGRWAGHTDPNGDDLQVWQRDHSNGDQASKQHCWRIVLQSPPSFITDADGEESPFDKTWIEKTRIFTPTSGEGYTVEAAFKRVPMAVTQYRKLRFVAQDPQAKDSVTIMLLEDPGIVNNLKLGRSQCVERQVVEGDPSVSSPMCRARDMINLDLYPNEPWMAPLNTQSRSSCSRAERTIEYTALASEAGKQYRVCMVARDDSGVCSGVAPQASKRGWYGETHCIIFDVLRPVLEWVPETLSLFSGEVEALVGCTTSLTVMARDMSTSAVTSNTTHPTGNYHVLISLQPSVALPEGMVLEEQAAVGDGCRARTGSCSAQRQLTWRPSRGTEGRRYRVCMAVGDEHGMTSLGKSCHGGARDGHSCHDHTECPGSTPEAPGKMGGPPGTCTVMSHCITVHVVRCRYCAEGRDSLSKAARDYGVDMNWLRMWALNGNLNGDASFSNALIRNPDLIQAGTKAQHLLVGVTYASKDGESLLFVAQRFRTTVKSILSLNFDLDTSAESSPQTPLPSGQHLCIIPCSNFAYA